MAHMSVRLAAGRSCSFLKLVAGEASPPPPPGRGCVAAQDKSRFGAAAKRRACAVGRLTCAPAGGGSGYFRSAETREREETTHTPER